MSKTALNVLIIAADTAYIALLTTGIVAVRKKSYPALTKAARRYWTAGGVAAATLVLAITEVVFYGGWWRLIPPVASLLLAVMNAVFIDRWRDEKFDEQTREWTS